MTSAIDSEMLDMTPDAVSRFAADTLPEKKLLDFDADDVDEPGSVYMRIEDYRTAELPGAADAVPIEPIREVFQG